MQKWRRVLYPAACLKRLLQFFRYGNGQAVIVIAPQEILYLGGKMMDVNHKGIAALGRKLFDDTLQHGNTRNWHKSLGHMVSNGPQPCAKTCGKNKRFHNSTFIPGMLVLPSQSWASLRSISVT